MKIPVSELPKQPNGAIYHLGLFPEEIADDIILVGDPGRVEKISDRFDKVELKRQNRELITHTGMKNGKRLSVISTGMGTDNIDIVLTELDALANIDLEKMEVKNEHKSLNLIRIGTSGALQAEIDTGSFVASAYGLGIDGVLQFYKNKGDFEDDLVEAFVKQTDWNEKLPYPYCTAASQQLLDKVAHDFYQGITVSAPGFFGPQGRSVRAPLMCPELNQKIEEFSFNGKSITNMEMECSAIYGLSKVLGHNPLTVCLIVANRVTYGSAFDYHTMMNKLIDTVLERLTI